MAGEKPMKLIWSYETNNRGLTAATRQQGLRFFVDREVYI